MNAQLQQFVTDLLVTGQAVMPSGEIVTAFPQAPDSVWPQSFDVIGPDLAEIDEAT